MKYFETLNISPVRLDLDPKELEAKYYREAFFAHPDKNAGSESSQIKTAEINEAYKTLKDPWARAEYVLKSLGFEAASRIPTAMAELYFEAQESRDHRILTEIEQRILQDEEIRKKNLEALFHSTDLAAPAPENLSRLKELVTEHKYAQSMLLDLNTKKVG